MVESIDRLMAELEAAAAALRARGAEVLPHESMRRVELRAAEVAHALIHGDPLPNDGTDELLSVAPDAAPPQDEQRPSGGELDAEAAQDSEEEDVFDEATVIEDDFGEPAGTASWEEAATFVSEEDSDIPLEFVAEESPVLDPELESGDEPSFVVEDEPAVADVSGDDEPTYVVTSTPAAPSQKDEPEWVVDESSPEPEEDDPSDAALVSFNDGTDSYITYDETPEVNEDEDEMIEPGPQAADDASSYVSYDEVPIGGVSDADLALGTELDIDEDEEVTLGSMSKPRLSARLPEDDGDGPSFSDVGEDALVTIEEDGDDVLGDLNDDEGIESFDLMPEPTEEEPVLEEDEVTLVAGLEEMAEEATAQADRAKGRASAPTPRVTAGLYGNPSVPTIREGNETAPKAAAVQLNSGGGGRMLGLDEEEAPIAIGSVADYGEDEEDYAGGDGLSIAIQEYEEEEEEEELELDEPEPEPEPIPVPKGPTKEEVQAAFEKAKAAANTGSLQDAADLFSDVIDADPDHLDAHVARGSLYLDLGDYSRAMSDFMVAEEIDDTSPEPQVAIGNLYFHRKDYRKAIDYFDTALKMAPNHAMAFCRRGISHYYRKNYKDALIDLEKANSLDPEIPNIASFISMAKRKAKARR